MWEFENVRGKTFSVSPEPNLISRYFLWKEFLAAPTILLITPWFYLMKFPTAHDFSGRCICSCTHPSALGAFPVSIVTGQFNISGLTVSYSEILCPFYKCAARGAGNKVICPGLQSSSAAEWGKNIAFSRVPGKCRSCRAARSQGGVCWITSAEGCVPSVPFLSLGKETFRKEEVGVGAGWVMKREIKTCK